MQVPRAKPSRNSIDHPGASTPPLTQISWGVRTPTEYPAANLQPQLGSKTFARTTGGVASRLLSHACLQSILSTPEVQTHGRDLRLALLLSAALFQTVPFSFCLCASIFLTSAVESGEPRRIR